MYDLGGVTVKVESAYLVDQDTEGIYKKLEEKIKSGQKISGEEQLQLMFQPLTVKRCSDSGRKSRQVLYPGR